MQHKVQRNTTTWDRDYTAALVQLSKQVAWIRVPILVDGKSVGTRKRPMPILAINGVKLTEQGVKG